MGTSAESVPVRQPRVEVTVDGYHLSIITERDGKAPDERVFCDRRAALVWPEAGRQGYFAIYGLDEFKTILGQRVLHLLMEGQGPFMQTLLLKLARGLRKYGCKKVCIDNSPKHQPVRRQADAEWVRIKGPGYDRYPSEAMGGMSQGYPLIRQKHAAGLVDVPKRSKLKREGEALQKIELFTEQTALRYPALQALGDVLNSYVWEPWEKPKRRIPYTGDREGYG